jgi:hypothetical protein
MPIGTYLYFHAVGAGNHVAVPCLVMYGAKLGTGCCYPRDQQLSGSLVRRILEKHNIRKPKVRSPDRPVEYVFSVTEYSRILSRQGGGGDVSEIFFGERGHGRISGETRVLQRTAGSWEAAP